jgi:UDP-3-O-[3-hydroxymyristoyl] glucosamine N-acyltransferase
VTWDGVVRLEGRALQVLASLYGGTVLAGAANAPERIVSIERAQEGDLAPLLARRFVKAAKEAATRGAALLVDASLAGALDADLAQRGEIPPASGPGRGGLWLHDHAAWAMAELLDGARVPDAPAIVGPGCSIASSAVLGPRVVLGARVAIGAGCVIGHPGFGWAFGSSGAVRAIPQLGGVVIEDDVVVGPLSTVDAGTLGPTRIRRGAKLDAHVHVGHNTEIGEGALIAAQCGFAGSVKIGRGVLVGGQVGIADHVIVGDGARIAAKSGVIGDIPPGATVAGYPAVPRMRWLRALAHLYAAVRSPGDTHDARE